MINIDIYLISDIIGVIGVGLVIIAYLLLQKGTLTANSNSYLYANLLGSIMLLFSLYFHWNLASVVIEILWLIISIYGIYKSKMLHINNKKSN